MENLILHGKVWEVVLMIATFKRQFGGKITLKELTEKLKPISEGRFK